VLRSASGSAVDGWLQEQLTLLRDAVARVEERLMNLELRVSGEEPDLDDELWEFRDES
jgi:hypothetical protein